MNYDNIIFQITTDIHRANDRNDVEYIYTNYFYFLKETGGRIIYSNKNGLISLNDFFAEYETYCKSLFLDNKFDFYSPSIKNNPIIDYSISYDSSFASNIGKYLEKKQIPPKFQEFLEKILIHSLKDNIDHNYLPYFLENIFKDDVSIDSILRNVKVIIKFFNLNINSAEDILKMKIYDDEKYNQDCKRKKDFIINASRNDGIKSEILYWHGIIYLILLKAIYINRRYNSEQDKIKKIMDFMQEELASIWKRELLIVIKYFKKEKLEFFNKVNNDKKDDILKKIDNMAWDLNLLRIIEFSFKLIPNPKSDLFFPFFATFDEGLMEIIDNYKIKAIIYFENYKYPMQVISNEKIDNEYIEKNGLYDVFQNYMTEDAINLRRKKLEELEKNINNKYLYIQGLIKNAEQDILLG